VLLVRLLGSTWRVTRRNAEVLEQVRRGDFRCLLLLWHGELLAQLWAHRNMGFRPMVSTHADGEVISRISAALGLVPVRGSSSRDGVRALLEAVRALESGEVVAVTPDGPRGPRFSFAPGAVAAARRAGAVVVALRAEVDRAWRLRSWDRFLIPKPFARITIWYAVAGTVAPDGGNEVLEREAERFRQVMLALAPDQGA